MGDFLFIGVGVVGLNLYYFKLLIVGFVLVMFVIVVKLWFLMLIILFD